MNQLVKFDFHGDSIHCLEQDGKLWVAVKPVCQGLGLDHKGQQAKLATKTWACVETISMQLPGDAQRREVFCIDLDSLPMWLATIEPSRVAESVRSKLERYQRECAKVLRDHFFGAQAKQTLRYEELLEQFEQVLGELGESREQMANMHATLRSGLTMPCGREEKRSLTTLAGDVAILAMRLDLKTDFNLVTARRTKTFKRCLGDELENASKVAGIFGRAWDLMTLQEAAVLRCCLMQRQRKLQRRLRSAKLLPAATRKPGRQLKLV